MDNFCVASTPSTSRGSSSHFAEALSPQNEMRILDQVSRLTLEEPGTPPVPPPLLYATPQVRKRKPSFIVTPPRGPAIPRLGSQMVQSQDRQRGAPPMMPASPEFDASSKHNPFERHRPLHSPFSGVSSLNVEFMSTFQAQEPSVCAETSGMNRKPLLKMANRRGTDQRVPLSVFLLDTAFPALEDEYENSDPPICRSEPTTLSTTRALKMRRRNRDDFPFLKCTF